MTPWLIQDVNWKKTPKSPRSWPEPGQHNPAPPRKAIAMQLDSSADTGRPASRGLLNVLIVSSSPDLSAQLGQWLAQSE